MYINNPLKEYLDDLASRKPAPGGGSAAALAAAVGTSLMSMVANFTIGKPKYKAVEKRVSDILDKIRQYDKELRQIIDEDVIAFEKMSNGLKACGDDASSKDELYKDAIEPPFLVCELAHHCLLLCKELADIGNKNLITDVAVAAIMLEGAFFAAKFNVYINLKCIEDNDYIGKVHKVLHPLEGQMPKLKEEIIEMCERIVK